MENESRVPETETVENTTAVRQSKNNPFKVATIVLSIGVIVLGGYLAYLLLGNASSPADIQTNSASAFAVDLTPTPLAVPLAEQRAAKNGVTTLSINDLSDSYTNKYLAIPEWGLKIKTKYADLLEYSYQKRDASWKAGSTPYAACNADYLFCNSIVQIQIKDKYLKLTKDSAGVDVKASDRTIAYIFQDNRSLSQAGEIKARYWTNEAFKTEFGKTATLIFEQAHPAGLDDFGKVFCPADLTVYLDSDTPCEDIFISIYKFDVSK